MADQLTFYNSARSDLFDKVTGEKIGGRAVVQVNITFTDDLTGEAQSAPLTLHLMGPGDVTGLQASAVVRTAPKASTREAETTKLAHIDFAEVDLPWRYAFEPPRPWIVLITGTTDELELVNGAVKIKDPRVLAAHDLKQSAMWAHVEGHVGERQVARLISPRGLESSPPSLQPNHEYIAAVVPAYTLSGASVIPSWEVTNNLVTRKPDGNVLPAYYAWSYWTADAGDFKTLAAKLHAVAVGGLGRAQLRYERVDPVAEVEVRGAITSLAATEETKTALVPPQNLPTTWPPATVPAPAAVLADLVALDTELHDPRRPVIGLPIYGRPWLTEPNDTDWGRLLNDDPRFRGIAGLGAWLAIEAQEELVDAARQQVGALEEAAQRVRYLAFGLAAARSLWKRRLPADPLQQLWLFGPTLRRIPAGNGGPAVVSAMDLVTGGTRTLPRALLSSAARRMLRPGDGIAKHAKEGAATRSALLNAANQCLPLPGPSAAGVDGVLGEIGLPGLGDLLKIKNIPDQVQAVIKDVVSSGKPINSNAVAERLFGALQNVWGVPQEVFQRLRDRLQPYDGKVVTRPILEDAVRPFLGDIFIGHDLSVDYIIALIDQIGPKLERPCNQVDLSTLGQRVSDSINPLGGNAPAIKRVQATISGIDIGNLEPLEVCIGLNYEVWKLLRDKATSWLLPGIKDLEHDAVVAMESNPAFVDALLVGLNTQLLGELHWRNMAIAPKCTPLRWFWGNFDYKNNVRTDDIRGIDLWGDTRLGDKGHQARQADNRDLVMVFRTDLFRRYPSTLVYLTNMAEDLNKLADVPDFVTDVVTDQHPLPMKKAIGPKIKGHIGDDVTFFIFDVKPTDLPQYRVVLDEPPHELRFRNNKGWNPLLDSATLAANVLLDTPTRVAIDGTYLDWKGLPA